MKIVFMGTPKAAVPSLGRILVDGHEVVAVYTQPDRPAGRGNPIRFSPVKDFAIQHDVPVFQPQKIRTPEELEAFRSHNADVAVVVAYGRILPVEFLDAFPLGAINVHFSLLPKYRGAAPVNWAIANGETETGVTTMRMDEGLDTGDILLQKTTKIGEDETAVELTERLSLSGAELLSETLKGLRRIDSTAQKNVLATYAPILKREDGLIDWNRKAGEIAHLVRGFQPFPTAFTFYKQSRVTIWKAHSLQNAAHKIINPGEITKALGGEILIGCGGNSTLSIGELQLEGKRRMSARDFLNGVKLIDGERLGECSFDEPHR